MRVAPEEAGRVRDAEAPEQLGDASLRRGRVEVAMELVRRLKGIFLRGENGCRPLYGGTRKFQDDPYWKDYILFYEYFHGDNGAGLGASHQTGWTGIIARILDAAGRIDARDALDAARMELAHQMVRPPVAAGALTAS